MNTGAAAAQGEILLFLHADCRIPADSLQVITRACTEQGVCGGAFTHSFGNRVSSMPSSAILSMQVHAIPGLFLGILAFLYSGMFFFRQAGLNSSRFVKIWNSAALSGSTAG